MLLLILFSCSNSPETCPRSFPVGKLRLSHTSASSKLEALLDTSCSVHLRVNWAQTSLSIFSHVFVPWSDVFLIPFFSSNTFFAQSRLELQKHSSWHIPSPLWKNSKISFRYAILLQLKVFLELLVAYHVFASCHAWAIKLQEILVYCVVMLCADFRLNLKWL